VGVFVCCQLREGMKTRQRPPAGYQEHQPRGHSVASLYGGISKNLPTAAYRRRRRLTIRSPMRRKNFRNTQSTGRLNISILFWRDMSQSRYLWNRAVTAQPPTLNMNTADLDKDMAQIFQPLPSDVIPNPSTKSTGPRGIDKTWNLRSPAGGEAILQSASHVLSISKI
jgi:hypothetical protein